MDIQDKQAFIQTKALENQHAPNRDKILWSRHAIGKLIVKGLSQIQVETILQTCTIVEDYPMVGRPLPDCLVLGYWQGKPVHVVVAMDGEKDRIFVVTVYRPSPDRWKNDWQTRKK